MKDYFQKLDTCPGCGKRLGIVHEATSWRGRGYGVRGASYYEATSFEKPKLEEFCNCDGKAQERAAKYEPP